jgi:hypothetical protein
MGMMTQPHPREIIYRWPVNEIIQYRRRSCWHHLFVDANHIIGDTGLLSANRFTECDRGHGQEEQGGTVSQVEKEFFSEGL